MKTIHLYACRHVLVALLLSGLCVAQMASSSTGDKPFRIIKKDGPVFPTRLLQESVFKGEVQMVLHVDAAGKLVDQLLVAYSHEGFAEVTSRAIKKWVFAPTVIGGTPVGTVVHMTFQFRTEGLVVIDRKPGLPSELEQWVRLGHYAYKACPSRDLDQPLKALSQEQPIYPQELRSAGLGGKVQVTFYVDEQGRPRVPVVVGDCDKTLGSLAVAAVERWKFSPPTRKGTPVLVCASQEFQFVPAK